MTSQTCALCQCGIDYDATTTTCPECRAVYHAECHDENQGCGNYGCGQVPESTGQEPAAPPSYWGAEKKDCPKCGNQIQATAIRCRHCGTVFDTTEPMSQAEFRDRAASKESLKSLRLKCRLVFFGGLVPLTAPVALVAGAVMASTAKDRRIPPLERLLIHLGVGLSVMWIVVAVLATAS